MASSQLVAFGSAAVSDNTTRYVGVSGFITPTATEADCELPVREAGVFSNLYTIVSTNATTTVSSTITLRKSRADTAVLVTYTFGQTGVKEDTSNTATFAATDEIDYEITVPNESGAPKAMTVTLVGVMFAPTTTANCLTILGNVGSATINGDSTEVDASPVGPLSWSTDVNLVNYYPARIAFTSSNFYVSVSANARTTDVTFGTGASGGLGNQTVVYTSGQTGAKEDTTHTDVIAIDVNFNYYVITLAGTETMTVTAVSSTAISTSSEFLLLVAKVSTAVAAAATSYFCAASSLTAASTESNIQIVPRFTFTAKELGVYVSANASNGTTTMTLRDGTADSAVTVNFTTGQIGQKADSSNTATITSGTDAIDYSVANAGSSGSCTLTWINCVGSTAVSVNRIHEFTEFGNLVIESPGVVAV